MMRQLLTWASLKKIQKVLGNCEVNYVFVDKAAVKLKSKQYVNPFLQICILFPFHFLLAFVPSITEFSGSF